MSASRIPPPQPTQRVGAAPKNAEPQAFEPKRTRAPAARGEAPFLPKGARRGPNR